MAEIGNSKYKIIYEDGILSEYYGDTLKSQRFLPMEEVELPEPQPDITHYLKTFQFATTLKDGDVDFSQVDMSNVTTMSSMFYNCTALQSLDLSSWNTSKVTGMNQMFTYCSALTSVDLSNWDTSNVTTLEKIFNGCSSLTSLDLSNFNTSNVTSMQNMFDGCSSLTSLDLSSWNTSNVTSMQNMFYQCKALTSLDLSSWDTSKVTSVNSMFGWCTNITTLNLGNDWDMNKVTNVSSMFGYCYALANVTGTISNIKKTIDLKYSPLTNESAMVFVNGLANVTSTQTITFKASTYATLTEEQIQIATDKGWSVASA